jgi:putative nucleotidyltransferase with HDIG domain
MNQRPARILIVDDEPAILETVREFLSLLGYDCATAASAEEAIERIGQEAFDLVLTDLHLGALTGMDVLEAVGHDDPARTLVVIMTAFPTIENAIVALKNGAEDYLLKPFSLENLELVVGRVLEKQRLARENISLRESLALYRASEALEAPLELPEYLRTVLDVAVNELQGEAAQLALLEEPDGINNVWRLLPREQVGRELQLGSEDVRSLVEEMKRGEGALLRTREGGEPLLALPLRAGGEMVGLIAVHRRPGADPFTPAQARALIIIGAGAAVAIKNARLYNALQEQYLRTVRALVAAVEAKDPYTSGHSEMVSRYVVALAREVGLEPDRIDGLRVAALLHDAGKIGVPEAVLLKPSELDAGEYDIIKEHVVMSERIVAPLELDDYIVQAIAQHHERLDGSGYPQGLEGEGVTVWGRLMAIADSYDAMISDRVYRLRMSPTEAVVTLRRLAPARLDADLVEAFVRVLEKRDRGEVDIPAVDETTPKTEPPGAEG